MLYVITGKPGDGKTQYTIKIVMDRAKAENRPVFYKRIDDLKLDWEELEEDQHWNDAPDGAIVVLDECQNDFRNRTMSSKVPPHVAELETHRHRGIDIYAITQNATLIDNNVRKLAGEHIHIHNPFKTNSATVLRFSEVVNDPLKAKQGALQKTTFRFDKDIWELYKSATVHTHKRRIPGKIYGILLLLVALGFVAYFTYNKLFIEGLAAGLPEGTVDTPVANNIVSAINPGVSKNDGMTKEEYIKQYIPRLKGRIETAPIYDAVRSIQSYPRIQCLVTKTKGCRCYTQQATQIDVTDRQCLYHVADGGYFNNALPDYALNAYGDNYDDDAYYRNIEFKADLEEDEKDITIVTVGKKPTKKSLRYSKARPDNQVSK